jgi:hypothetical protein
MTDVEEDRVNLHKPEYFLKMQFLKSVLKRNQTNKNIVLCFSSLLELFAKYCIANINDFFATRDIVSCPILSSSATTVTFTKFSLFLTNESELTHDNIVILLKHVQELKTNTATLWQMLQTYFYESWQITYSVYMNPEGQLWTEHPDFVQFIRTTFSKPAFLDAFQQQLPFMFDVTATSSLINEQFDTSEQNKHLSEFLQQKSIVHYQGHILDKLLQRLRVLVITKKRVLPHPTN